MKTYRLLSLVIFSAFLGVLAGCSLPSATQEEQSSYVRAWFDAPLPNSVYVPPNPCLIVGHGASPAGIALFELSINDVAMNIPSPDAQNSLVTLTQDCGVSEPGEYRLLLRAQDNNGNWSGYAETSLIILSQETETPLPATETPVPDTPVPDTPTITPTPTATPTPEPSDSVSVERVSDKLVYIGASSCGPVQTTFTVRANAAKGIKVVVLFYRFQTGNASTEFQSISMNPAGSDLFTRTLNLPSLTGGSIPFEQATLQYQVVVQQNDGDTSLRTPVMADIAVQACGSVTRSCSSYTDPRSCAANGCNWVAIPGGTVPIYECRNP